MRGSFLVMDPMWMPTSISSCSWHGQPRHACPAITYAIQTCGVGRRNRSPGLRTHPRVDGARGQRDVASSPSPMAGTSSSPAPGPELPSNMPVRRGLVWWRRRCSAHRSGGAPRASAICVLGRAWRALSSDSTANRDIAGRAGSDGRFVDGSVDGLRIVDEVRPSVTGDGWRDSARVSCRPGR